ncbi:restriction endonuclease subunit S [Intestinibacter bartlettii]|uniref:restriction endonuclease subunit S n=1 Tax=Intestinibacter bartlettii TaxID=261299 RepID=UPI0034A2D3B9
MSREMKDSGIEWIGEIPKDWEIKPLKHILKERKEKNDPIITKDILSLTNDRGVIPYDEKGNQGNKSKNDLTGYKIAYPNDIVLNSMNVVIGSVGKSKYFGCVSPVYYMLYPINKNFDIDYYNFIFQTKVFQNNLKGYGNGILEIRMRISMEKLNTVCLPVPSIKLQREIVNFLNEKVGEIDRLIDNAKKSIEEYKKYKQSVITEAVTKGLDSNVEMKDSGVEWIGEIPKDWEFRKIKSFSDIISKGTTPKEMSTIKDSKYTIRYIKSENIVDDKLIDKPEFYITNDVNEELKRSQLTDKDILFVIAGASIGKVAIMEGDLLPANTNQAISFIRIKDEYLIYKKYLWYFLQSNIIKVVINLYSVQSAQPNLSMENLGNIKIPFPFYKNDINEIIEYLDNKCYEIENLIFKKEKLISELESYKKSLIYEYVTGKKEV